MVFGLFLCIGHTKYRAGIQILMICNSELHQPRFMSDLAKHGIEYLQQWENERCSFKWFCDIP